MIDLHLIAEKITVDRVAKYKALKAYLGTVLDRTKWSIVTPSGQCGLLIQCSDANTALSMHQLSRIKDYLDSYNFADNMDVSAVNGLLTIYSEYGTDIF